MSERKEEQVFIRIPQGLVARVDAVASKLEYSLGDDARRAVEIAIIQRGPQSLEEDYK